MNDKDMNYLQDLLGEFEGLSISGFSLPVSVLIIVDRDNVDTNDKFMLKDSVTLPINIE